MVNEEGTPSAKHVKLRLPGEPSKNELTCKSLWEIVKPEIQKLVSDCKILDYIS